MLLTRRLLFPLYLNLVLALLGFVLVVFGENPSEASAILYSGVAAAVALLTSWLVDSRFSNWTLWLFGFYFLLYPFGSLVGLLLFGPTESFLNYETWFASGIEPLSRQTSYLLTGSAISFLAIFAALSPPRKSPDFPRHDNFLDRIGTAMFLVSLPMVLIHYIWIFKNFSGIGYYTLFSAESSELTSPVPFVSVWTNVNKAGFLLFLSSVPTRRKFFWLSLIYLLVSLTSALFGGRIHFLVPLAMILWYRSHLFQSGTIKLGRALALLLLAVLFGFVMQSYRSSESIELDGIMTFLIYSISKAQYHVALFIDNMHLLADSGPFWLAPIAFPLYYLRYGSEVVGQSYSSASLRADLSHVLSSKLNMEAYTSGAGLGSSLVAESFQYGPVAMPFILALFYFAYRWFFNCFTRNRLFLLIAPLVFSHVIFSPRDSLFPYTWNILKYLVIGMAVMVFRQIVMSYKSVQHNEHPEVRN